MSPLASPDVQVFWTLTLLSKRSEVLSGREANRGWSSRQLVRGGSVVWLFDGCSRSLSKTWLERRWNVLRVVRTQESPQVRLVGRVSQPYDVALST